MRDRSSSVARWPCTLAAALRFPGTPEPLPPSESGSGVPQILSVAWGCLRSRRCNDSAGFNMTPRRLRMTELHFREWKTPAGFATSAVIPEKLSCGIYELSFTNEELYVGQTVNFPARFSSHRRRWDDIEAVRFAEAIPDELDEKERAAIRSRVEQKRQLRNKTLLSQPVGPSPLDLIVDPQAQAEWLQHDARSEPPGVDPERITLASDGSSPGSSSRSSVNTRNSRRFSIRWQPTCLK